MHFVVLPTIRQRRLVPVPAVVYKSGFLAGYEPSLDATAVSFGTKDKSVSTILVMPGQQGMTAPGDGLARLEKRLVESSFKKGMLESNFKKQNYIQRIVPYMVENVLKYVIMVKSSFITIVS